MRLAVLQISTLLSIEPDRIAAVPGPQEPNPFNASKTDLPVTVVFTAVPDTDLSSPTALSLATLLNTQWRLSAESQSLFFGSMLAQYKAQGRPNASPVTDRTLRLHRCVAPSVGYAYTLDACAAPPAANTGDGDDKPWDEIVPAIVLGCVVVGFICFIVYRLWRR